jgi:hypothetical protein
VLQNHTAHGFGFAVEDVQEIHSRGNRTGVDVGAAFAPEEVDKISDYGDGAVLPIAFDVLNVEDTHYELEVPVVSHGGDRGKIALFLLKFRLRAKG